MPEELEDLPREIPAVKARYIAAILEQAVAQGANLDRILRGTLLAREAVFGADAFLPSVCAYAAVERAQRLCGNLQLTAEVAGSWHKPGSLLRVSAGYSPESVSDFLLMIIKEASAANTGVESSMSLKADQVLLRGTRAFSSPHGVGQGDAWGIAAWVTIMMTLMAEAWDSSRVFAKVADPKAIPPELLPPSQIQKGDKTGPHLEFPSEWLMAKIAPDALIEQSAYEQTERSPTLQDVFSAFDLRSLPNAEDVARLLGLTPRTFHRRLAERGTSFSELIDEQREMRACELLKGSTQTVREIAALLGYRNESSFNRAFKRWREVSPSVYRAAFYPASTQSN